MMGRQPEKILLGILLVLTIISCGKKKQENPELLFTRVQKDKDPPVKLESPWMDSLDYGIIIKAAKRPVDGFDFPVGAPNADDYFRARGLIMGEHYGEDWNHRAGGNKDFGHLVYSIADGYVFYGDTASEPGWGMVVRMLHNTGSLEEPKIIESLYAHLASMWVKPGNFIRRGQPIGTIGTAEGIYHAHLHFEMRDFPGMPLHPRYGADSLRFLDPTGFIQLHRPKGRQMAKLNLDSPGRELDSLN